MSSVGLEMGLAVVVGYLLGVWIDGELGSAPYGLVFGLIAGFGAAAKGLYRVASRAKAVMARPEPDALPPSRRAL